MDHFFKYILLMPNFILLHNLLRKRMPTIFFNNFTVIVLSLRKNYRLEYLDRKKTNCMYSQYC